MKAGRSAPVQTELQRRSCGRGVGSLCSPRVSAVPDFMKTRCWEMGQARTVCAGVDLIALFFRALLFARMSLRRGRFDRHRIGAVRPWARLRQRVRLGKQKGFGLIGAGGNFAWLVFCRQTSEPLPELGRDAPRTWLRPPTSFGFHAPRINAHNVCSTAKGL